MPIIFKNNSSPSSNTWLCPIIHINSCNFLLILNELLLCANGFRLLTSNSPTHVWSFFFHYDSWVLYLRFAPSKFYRWFVFVIIGVLQIHTRPLFVGFLLPIALPLSI